MSRNSFLNSLLDFLFPTKALRRDWEGFSGDVLLKEARRGLPDKVLEETGAEAIETLQKNGAQSIRALAIAH